MAEQRQEPLRAYLLRTEDRQRFFGCSAECITDAIREGRLPQPKRTFTY